MAKTLKLNAKQIFALTETERLTGNVRFCARGRASLASYRWLLRNGLVKEFGVYVPETNTIENINDIPVTSPVYTEECKRYVGYARLTELGKTFLK